MNLKRVFDIYDILKNRLPKTYPRPKLAFYEDEESMIENNKVKVAKDEAIYAIVDPKTSTINLPMHMEFEYVSKSGEIIKKIVPITKQEDEEIAHTLLHECCHLLAGDRYGYDSKQYHDEKYCDSFAARWIKILKKENLL